MDVKSILALNALVACKPLPAIWHSLPQAVIAELPSSTPRSESKDGLWGAIQVEAHYSLPSAWSYPFAVHVHRSVFG